MIFVNFKSSYDGTGERALVLIKKLQIAQEQTPVKIIPVPHNLDVYSSRQTWKDELWLQHADYEYGGTGRTAPEMISRWSAGWRIGISGTFLNHSEHKYHEWNKLELSVEDLKKFNVKSMVFGADKEELAKIAQMKVKPDFICFEPPELIASPDTSVAKADQEGIKRAVEIAKNAGIPLIVGAGVKDAEDVRVSLSLGVVGVAVSSAIVQAEDPIKVVLDLAEGFE